MVITMNDSKLSSMVEVERFLQESEVIPAPVKTFCPRHTNDNPLAETKNGWDMAI